MIQLVFNLDDLIPDTGKVIMEEPDFIPNKGDDIILPDLTIYLDEESRKKVNEWEKENMINGGVMPFVACRSISYTYRNAKGLSDLTKITLYLTNDELLRNI